MRGSVLSDLGQDDILYMYNLNKRNYGRLQLKYGA